MLKRKVIDSDYCIGWIYHAIFESGTPLTQEEIVEWVYCIYKKRWMRRTAEKHINRAVKHGRLSVQNQDDRIVYTPIITYEEFRVEEEQKMNEWMNSSEFPHHTTFHAAPKVMTTEEYKRIKKLIDELE